MTLQQLFIILGARWRIVLAAFLVTVAATTVVSLLMPKKYEATAAVVVDMKTPDPLSGAAMAGIVPSSYMATQVDIITSPRVAKAAAKLLHFDVREDLRDRWQ